MKGPFFVHCEREMFLFESRTFFFLKFVSLTEDGRHIFLFPLPDRVYHFTPQLLAAPHARPGLSLFKGHSNALGIPPPFLFPPLAADGRANAGQVRQFRLVKSPKLLLSQSADLPRRSLSPLVPPRGNFSAVVLIMMMMSGMIR